MKNCSRRLIAVITLIIFMAGCRTTDQNSDLANAKPGALDCAKRQPTSDPSSWLLAIRDQKVLYEVFLCAKAPQQIPLGIGRGVGSLMAGLVTWNVLQKHIGAMLWGGKRLYSANNGVELTNLMTDSGDERYNASVYVAPSIIDSQPAMILDYRIDNSLSAYGLPNSPAQIAVDNIVTGIRDEVRELQMNGQPSGVYVGRANILTRYLISPLRNAPNDKEFGAASSWTFAANFFLDFNKKN